jgi:hypothetical protein
MPTIKSVAAGERLATVIFDLLVVGAVVGDAPLALDRLHPPTAIAAAIAVAVAIAKKIGGTVRRRG